MPDGDACDAVLRNTACLRSCWWVLQSIKQFSLTCFRIALLTPWTREVCDEHSAHASQILELGLEIQTCCVTFAGNKLQRKSAWLLHAINSSNQTLATMDTLRSQTLDVICNIFWAPNSATMSAETLVRGSPVLGSTTMSSESDHLYNQMQQELVKLWAPRAWFVSELAAPFQTSFCCYSGIFMRLSFRWVGVFT